MSTLLEEALARATRTEEEEPEEQVTSSLLEEAWAAKYPFLDNNFMANIQASNLAQMLESESAIGARALGPGFGSRAIASGAISPEVVEATYEYLPFLTAEGQSRIMRQAAESELRDRVAAGEHPELAEIGESTPAWDNMVAATLEEFMPTPEFDPTQLARAAGGQEQMRSILSGEWEGAMPPAMQGLLGEARLGEIRQEYPGIRDLLDQGEVQPSLGSAYGYGGGAPPELVALEQIPEDVRKEYESILEYVRTGDYRAWDPNERSLLDLAVRVYDSGGVALIREGLNSFVNRDDTRSWVDQTWKGYTDFVRNTFLGTEPAQSEIRSFIDVNRTFLLGSNPEKEDLNWAEEALAVSLGIAGDIFIDPLWIYGGIGRLGAKATALENIRPVLDDLGRMSGRTPRTLRELEQMLATDARATEAARQAVAPTYTISSAGEVIPRLPTAGEFQELERIRIERISRGLERPIPGTDQWRVIESAFDRYGTVYLPESMAAQYRMGARGLLNYNFFRTTPTPTLLSRATRGRLSWGREPLPVGRRAAARVTEILETQFKVTDGWTFMDMFLNGGLHTGGIETRQLRRLTLRERERAAVLTRVTGYQGGVEAQTGEASLRAAAQELWENEDIWLVADKAGYNNDFDVFYRALQRQVNNFSEITLGIRADAVEITRVPEEITDVARFGEPVGGDLIPSAPAREGLMREVIDPLIDPGLPHEFNHPHVRGLIEDVRGAAPARLSEESAAFLQTTQLHTGWDDLDDLTRILESEEATAYVWHRIRPETWRQMQEKGWLVRDTSTEMGWRLSRSARNRLSTYSRTLERRADQAPLEVINDRMRSEHGIENFYEFDPNKLMSLRWAESQRRIIAADYHGRLGNYLWNYADDAGEYIYRVPQTTDEGGLIAGEMNRGWVSLFDATPTGYSGFMPQVQDFARQIQVPPEVARMLDQQSMLLLQPERLQGFMRSWQMATNWWKANTLAAWPNYHGGNILSNYYLNWLGGVSDPLMYGLAAKIRRGTDGIVRSAYTGQTYSYRELRALSEGNRIGHGWIRTNIDRLTEGSHLVEGDRHWGDFIRNSFADVTGQYERTFVDAGLRAGTGITPKIKEQTWMEYLTSFTWAPGGPEAAINKIGFNFGNFWEGMARDANFFDGILNQGLRPEVAAARVNRTLFDYNKDTATRQIMSTVLPFHEFFVQNTIFHLIQGVQDPARVGTALRLQQSTVPSILERDIEYEGLAEWDRNRALIPLPGGVLDISRHLPFAEVPTNIRDLPGELAGLGNVFLDIGLGMMAETDSTGAFVGFGVPSFLGGPAEGYDWFRNEPLETGKDRAEYFFSSLFRAVNEFGYIAKAIEHRAWPWRTIPGFRVIQYDRATQIHYDLKDSGVELNNARRNVTRARTPIIGEGGTLLRLTETAEGIDDSQRELVGASLRHLLLLMDQYATGEQPWTGDVINNFDHQISDSVQIRSSELGMLPDRLGEGYTSRESILGEMQQILVGTRSDRSDGLLYLSQAINDPELEAQVWSSIDENLQRRIVLELSQARMECGEFFDMEAIIEAAGDEGISPQTRELITGSRTSAGRHYDNALNYISNVMTLPGESMEQRVEYFGMWIGTLRQKTELGLPSDYRERLSNFINGSTNEILHRPIYEAWLRLGAE